MTPLLRSKLFLVVGGGVGLLLAAVAASAAFPYQTAVLARTLERGVAGLEAKNLQVGDMQIAYVEGGSGEPLVLLHGIGADKDNWTRVARYLTPHYRVIALDLPGFGESSKPREWRYRTQDQVERVHAIVAALGLQKPHFGGSSMGGFIAATYAARYPQEVASLWLIAPGGAYTAEPSEMIRKVQAGEPVPLFARTPEEFDEVLGFVFAERPYIPGSIKQVLAERAAANYALNMQVFGDIRSDSIQLENLVAGLPVPARIVWGEQDRVLHVSGARILGGLMPKSSVLVLPGVGHLPMLERPQAVADDYRAFRAAL